MWAWLFKLHVLHVLFRAFHTKLVEDGRYMRERSVLTLNNHQHGTPLGYFLFFPVQGTATPYRSYSQHQRHNYRSLFLLLHIQRILDVDCFVDCNYNNPAFRTARLAITFSSQSGVYIGRSKKPWAELKCQKFLFLYALYENWFSLLELFCWKYQMLLFQSEFGIASKCSRVFVFLSSTIF